MGAYSTALLALDPDGACRRAAPWALDTATRRRRGLAAFLALSEAVTFGVWMTPLVAAISAGEPPELRAHYSGRVTDALDLGLVTPACLTVAWLVWRRVALGILLAVPLLFLEAMLLPMMTAQTLFQVRFGVTFSTPQIVGPFAGFLLISGIAAVLLVRLLRELDAEARAHFARPKRSGEADMIDVPETR